MMTDFKLMLGAGDSKEAAIVAKAPDKSNLVKLITPKDGDVVGPNIDLVGKAAPGELIVNLLVFPLCGSLMAIFPPSPAMPRSTVCRAPMRRCRSIFPPGVTAS